MASRLNIPHNCLFQCLCLSIQHLNSETLSQIPLNTTECTMARTPLAMSRVAAQNQGERNFHIFYQLLSVDDTSFLKSLKISRNAENYHFLKGSGCVQVETIDDKENFYAVKNGMEVIGFQVHEIFAVFQLVASVLKFGNLEFHHRSNLDGTNGCVLMNEYEAQEISELIGCSAEDLQTALTQRTVEARGEKLKTDLSTADAAYARDALCKAIYSRMFSWLVQRINDGIRVKKKTKTKVMGVLDIYGFEVFENNSFEQFIINYCNEKLQQIFIELTLKEEQEEYVKEGIEWIHVDYFNNAVICDLIEKNNVGILAMLDEECLRPGTVTDLTFLEKLDLTCSEHPHYESRGCRKSMSDRSLPHEAFRLKHYAGAVTYKVEGFLDKNNDLLFRDLSQAMYKCRHPLLKELFPEGNPVRPSLKRPATAGSQFKSHSSLLSPLLHSCYQSFPPLVTPPVLFPPLITSSGVPFLHLVTSPSTRILPSHHLPLQSPFPVPLLIISLPVLFPPLITSPTVLFLPFSPVLSPIPTLVTSPSSPILPSRHPASAPNPSPSPPSHQLPSCLVPSSHCLPFPSRYPSHNLPSSPVPPSLQNVSVAELMKNLLSKNPNYIRCIKPNDFKKPIAFDEDLVRHQVRYLGLMENVQVRRAGYAFRQSYGHFLYRYKMLAHATWPHWDGPIQEGVKVLMESMGFSSRDYAFGKSKVFIRKPKTLFDMEEKRREQMHYLAVLIQKVWRGWRQRKIYQLMKCSEIIISCMFRGYWARKCFLQKKNATIVIQSFWRGYKARNLLKELKHQKRVLWAVSVIRKYYRGWQVRREYRNKFRAIAGPKIVLFFQVALRKKFLLSLRGRLPSMSPISQEWPRCSNLFKPTSEELRKIFHRWRCRKYREKLDLITQNKMKEKVIASDLFKGKKVTYPPSVPHPFKGDYLNLRSHFKWKKMYDHTHDQNLIFADMVLKVNRANGKMMQRLFVMSTEAILSIDQRTMSLKYRIPLAQIEKISASPYTDRLMVFHIKKENGGILSKKGDFIFSGEHIFEIITKAYILIQNICGKPPEVHISNQFAADLNGKKVDICFRRVPQEILPGVLKITRKGNQFDVLQH
ncbi:MYO1 [Acanthosepion pharaonis]|uniref:MYO1 n=1 Tax=Acanthosepion pharaonis TaxID=158019 RepID=A0A812E2H5_ACAPH|nr:MYO1 [Sepia pharaonis]